MPNEQFSPIQHRYSLLNIRPNVNITFSLNVVNLLPTGSSNKQMKCVDLSNNSTRRMKKIKMKIKTINQTNANSKNEKKKHKLKLPQLPNVQRATMTNLFWFEDTQLLKPICRYNFTHATTNSDIQLILYYFIYIYLFNLFFCFCFLLDLCTISAFSWKHSPSVVVK